MKKNIIFITLLLLLILSLNAAAEYEDLNSDHWAYKAVSSLSELGIVEGYPDGYFNGENKLSRYEMAVIISRIHNNLNQKVENYSSTLTENQVLQTEELIKSLIQKNTGQRQEFSSEQLKEIKFLIAALTIEYRSELEVLAADYSILSNDIEAIKNKIAELKIPEDKIEFNLETGTYFETTDYPSDPDERALALFAWTDEEVLDLEPVPGFTDMDYSEILYRFFKYNDYNNFGVFSLKIDDFEKSDDIDDFPTQRKFWQEYDLLISGNQPFGSFELELNTITNIFADANTVIPGYNPADQNSFLMDKALLSLNYQENYFRIGDLDDYQVKSYFLDENDLEGLEYRREYKDTEWEFLAAGTELPIIKDLSGFESNLVDVYSLTAEKRINSINYIPSFNQMRFEGMNISNLSLLVEDIPVNNSFALNGELVYNSWDLNKLSTATFFGRSPDFDLYFVGLNYLLDDNKGEDFYLNLEGDWKINDKFSLKPNYQRVGKEFFAVEADLEAPYDFDLFGISTDYQLRDNLKLNSAYSYIKPGSEWDKVYGDLIFAAGVEPEAKELFSISLAHQYDKFINSAAAEYEKNDNFFDGFDQLTVILKTIYQWNESTIFGAKIVHKHADWESNLINNGTEYDSELSNGYNYLEAFIDKKLRENIKWNLTGRIVDSNAEYIQDNSQGYDVDAVSSMLESSLIVSF